MKTFSVRDLRQRWPKAEALLRVEREIVITRDSRPVARLVRISADTKRRKRFDAAAQAAWQRKVAGRRVFRWVDPAGGGSRGPRARLWSTVIYLDTSCLLKMSCHKPERARCSPESGRAAGSARARC